MSRQKAPAPVIAVVGPTACGKTHLAVELAKWQQSEVVSADSSRYIRICRSVRLVPPLRKWTASRIIF